MKKILIIEDDTAFAELLKVKLSEKYQVELCEDGQSGYYAIYEYKPDVVLLSLTIAQMDPVSLVGKMRVQKQFHKLPIYVLADTKTLARADDAMASGANEAFLKDESGTINSVVAAIAHLMTPSLARKPATQTERAAIIVHETSPPKPVAPAIAAPAPVVASPTPVLAPLSPTPTHATGRARSNFETLGQIETTFDRGKGRARQEEEVSSLETFSTSYNSAFLDAYGESAHALRKDFIRYRTATGNDRHEHLTSLLARLSELNTDAMACGLDGLSCYLTVIKSRIAQLLESKGPANPSSLQGVAAALDALAALNNHVGELEPLNNLNPLALIVDDDNVCRKTLSLGLEKSKIKTTSVDNPDAALLEAESKPFDLIFLDVDLPKMNGFALCARIRIIASHRKTPILFVTSLNDIKSRASSRVSGGNDFITKPVNLYDLGINSWSLIINRRILHNGTPARA